jgi:hypothetical protein
MGATKRVMEHLAFLRGKAIGATTTSARFANVAFSNGSLLQSFLHRLSKKQPLALPRDTRRYFLSQREAGQLCLLAVSCVPDHHIAIPKLTAAVHECDLEAVAGFVLEQHGLKPRWYVHEEEARDAVAEDLNRGEYPVLVTPRDTAGERQREEFIAHGDEVVDIGMTALEGIRYAAISPSVLDEFVTEFDRIVASPATHMSKEYVISRLCQIVPNFKHVRSDTTLDERM